MPRFASVQNGTFFASLLAYVQLGETKSATVIGLRTASFIVCSRFQVKAAQNDMRSGSAISQTEGKASGQTRYIRES